ncbi:MAG: DegQ family serine endoprotease [Alphaproteobacteria bacterium]|nr:DegQ family serine endoprotease [Alphaproteobacteria bacterium]TAD87098.1 MAG: DegQ family serine endoprotease [Alphaproteobacteria bacterium]
MPMVQARRLLRVVPAVALAGLVLAAPLPGIGLQVAQAQSSPAARAAPAGFADLAERLLPAVVNISTTQAPRQTAQRGPGGGPGGPPQGERPQAPPGSPLEDLFREFFDRQQRGNPDQPQQQRRATSLGSGFVIDPAGYIVTNNHVIAEAEEITVTFHDDSTLRARLVGRDPRTDLALLKVEPRRPLTAVPWGDSDRARIGDWVMAIGNPFGLGGTVTVGILSARARDINAGPYDDFLQTDASINRGNSGGPLFDMSGNVIGINTAIYSPTGGSVGIGFAIPTTLARSVIGQLREFGRTRRGWLGVRIQSVTDELAESLGLDRARGALVSSTMDGGPAHAARIQSGDVILRFDGREVPDQRRLPRIVADTAIEKEVDVVLWRQRREMTVRVKVGELQEDQVAAAPQPTPRDQRQNQVPGVSVQALGLTVAPVTPPLRERFSLPAQAGGIVVTDVTQGSSAAERGVRPGDLILEVDQEEVKTPADLQRRLDAARQAGRRTVLMLVEQRGETRFLSVRLQ